MGRKLGLDVIDIAEPCSEDWGAMRGDERVRFCGLCHRNVYNLSALTREDAETLLAETEERLCVRFVRRADGTVTTADCTPDRLAALRRGAKRSLAFAGAAMAGLLALVGGLGFVSVKTGLVQSLVDELTEPEPCEYPLMGAMPVYEEPVDPSEIPEPEPPEDAPEIDLTTDA